MRKRVMAGIVGVAIALTQQFTPAFAAAAVTGPHGEILRVTKATAIRSGDAIVVTGQHFDETVGIYVAMCKVVPKGQLPTPCGGGADKTGTEGASEWISSNPPSYGIGLAKPYLPGGRFSVTVKCRLSSQCQRARQLIVARSPVRSIPAPITLVAMTVRMTSHYLSSSKNN